MADERMLALARRIVDSVYGVGWADQMPAASLVALTAIKETTEAAAKMADDYVYFSYSGPADIANALRNGDHLK